MSSVNITGGRAYVDIGRVLERKRSAGRSGGEFAHFVGSLVGAEYVVQDDLNNGGGKLCAELFLREDSQTS